MYVLKGGFLLSIFVMYSNDREDAFLRMLEFLEKMPLFDKCQKTLVVDGRLGRIYDGWDVVEVPRIEGRFCWGRMWDAGVLSAKNQKIVYLDSDRLLPSKFLKRIHDKIQDDTFVFTSQHFLMQKLISSESCQSFLDEENCFLKPDFIGTLQYDPRFKDPVHGPAKNVMSGSTGFTKNTYLRLGGVDHWYCGHGAYADSDFHYQASLAGCKFVDLNLTELHYPHAKRDDTSAALSYGQLKLMSLDNFIYYCRKWELPLVLAENVALKSNVKNPKKHVRDRLDVLKKSPRNRFE